MKVPLPEESVFFDKQCVMCGSSFDVPPEFVFDRQLSHYCADCISGMD